MLCPGAAFRPRGGFPRSVAKMVVDEGRVCAVRIEALTGTPLFEWGTWPEADDAVGATTHAAAAAPTENN